MISIKNYFNNTTSFITFTLVCIYSFNTPAVTNQNIQITDYKFYRIFKYNEKKLLFFKDKKIKGISYLNNNQILSYQNINGIELKNFKTDSKDKHYYLSTNKKKITFNSSNKAQYYLDQSELVNICKNPLAESVELLSSREISKKILNINIENTLNKNTCKGNRAELINTSLQGIFLSKKSSMINCFSNENIKELISQDPKLEEYSRNTLVKYYDLLDKVTSGNKPIQINCKTDDPKKAGSFDEKATPSSISVNMDLVDETAKTKDDKNKLVNQIMTHELFHYGNQLPIDKNKTNCEDESYADFFTKKCEEAGEISEQKNLNLNNTDSKNKLLKDRYEKCLIETRTKGNTSESMADINNTHNVQPQITKTITDKDFAKVPDSDFSKMMDKTYESENPSNYGTPYTVSANSDIGQATLKTFNSFSNSANTLTTKLNTALATTTNTALATTTNTALATTPTPPTTTISNLNSNTTSSTVNTYDKPTSNVNTNTNLNSRMPATENTPPTPYSSATEQNIESKSVTDNRTAAAANPASKTIASPTFQNNSSTSTPSQALTTPDTSAATTTAPGTLNRSPPNINTSANGKISIAAEGASIIKTIQSLKAFNKVSGSQYEEIKKNYKNSYFQNLLKTYDMRIMVKNNSGTYTSIGVEGKVAKKVFNDNGQILITIEEKK